MSLINDALKRANEAQKKNAQEQAHSAGAGEPSLRPVEAPRSSNGPIVIALVVTLLVVFGGGVWFFWQWSKTPAQRETVSAVAQVEEAIQKPAPPVETKAPSVPVAVPTAPVVTPAPTPKPPEPAPVAVPPPAPVPTTPDNSVATTPVAPPTAPAVPVFPTLKLQGIFYNPANPSAVINKRTVAVGGMVSGVKVIKIDQEAVTVEWNGQTNVLELLP